MDLQTIRSALADAHPAQRHEASVLIPLLDETDGLHILFEVRALTLEVQPGEVCLPGGGIEPGECPRKAAIRETCEELCLEPDQVELVGALGPQPGPGGMPLHVYVGVLHNYQGTFSPDEVDHTFSLPLDWLATHPPRSYEVALTPSYPDDYPWHLVPGGRAYRWRARTNRVPFYLGTDPVLWGATARVIERFVGMLA